MVRTGTIILVSAIVLGAAIVGAGVAIGDTNDAAGTLAQQSDSGPTDASDRSITVSASGNAESQPDEAIVRISVEANADDPTVARNRVAENVSAVRQALTQLGLAESQVRTVGFDLYQDREAPRPREPPAEPRTTYHASHDLEITVTDIDQTGTVIDTAIDAGATNVHNVQFTLAQETQRELRNEALRDAMSNARTQAETLAAASDLSVVGVETVSTNDVNVPVRPLEYQIAAGDAGGGTEIDGGPVTVTATVGVTYNATG